MTTTISASPRVRRPMVVGAVLASGAAVILAGFRSWPLDLPLLEVFAVVTGAGSVWTLSHNQPIGWWIGLGSVAAFGVVFFQARLFAEVGIQAFYFVTSLQAIWIWLRGGQDRRQRPVTRVPRRVMVVTVPLGALAVWGLWQLLIALNGAAPFWDALTVVMSLTAHVYLMWRFVDSWYLWIAVDAIYLPLYVSRGLALTAVLYAGFLVMSVGGLRRFRALIPERAAT